MGATNQTRVQVRTTVDEKAFLERAAHRCGFKTLSEFIRVSAHEKAKRDLKEFPILDAYQTPTEPTNLSSTDSGILADSIIKSQDPNELLKALMSKDNEQMLKELIAKKK